MTSRYNGSLASLLVLVMASGSVAQTLPAASAKPAGSASPAKSATAPATSAGATGKSVPTGASSATPTTATTPVGSALPPVPTTAPAPAATGSAGTTSADTPTAGAAPTLGPPTTAGKIGPRRTAPTLPSPTPQQLASLAALNQELGEYQTAAKDYRSTLTMIVRHHYDEKRRRVLSALDHEID
ncbi:MAG TPA: hypothetical protein VHU80_04365, partial [Polyangiaceae bacterium]|nr:hypothetical protein [Polyangiaceae bacterium]